MKVQELIDDGGDWEPEVESAPWRSFKVVPRDDTDGWTSFVATAKVYDAAFGPGNWGQSGIPNVGTFLPMKVSIKPRAKINYGALLDHGLKILFMEADPEYRKVHTLEGMPNMMHIDKSFYVEKKPMAPWFTYLVKQWLSDEVVAKVLLFPAPLNVGDNNASWTFRPTDESIEEEVVFVSDGQLYNALKLKWWIKNRLISMGLLSPIKEDIDSEFEQRRAENFGFRDDYKQFWFYISDMQAFMDHQHEWEAEKGRHTNTRSPDANFVEQIFNRFIMQRRSEHGDRENFAVVLRWGALRGNQPSTAPMVLMFNPKQAVPSTKAMKEFGLRPDFTYSGGEGAN